MSPIDNEKLDELLEDWVARQEAAAPELSPPAALRRKVARRRRRPLVLFARLATAAAVVFALAAIGRHFLGSDPAVPPPERPFELVAWEKRGKPEIDGPLLLQTRMKKGGAFAQLLFQYHHSGTSRVTSIDLEDPPGARVELAVGDRLRVGLRPARSSHVYVFLLEEGGEGLRLFPEPSVSPEANPLPGGDPVYLPAEPSWLGVNTAGEGTRLVAVAADEALPELEKADPELRSWLEEQRRDPRPGVEVVELVFDVN